MKLNTLDFLLDPVISFPVHHSSQPVDYDPVIHPSLPSHSPISQFSDNSCSTDILVSTSIASTSSNAPACRQSLGQENLLATYRITIAASLLPQHQSTIPQGSIPQGLEQPDKETSMKFQKDVVMKHPAPLPSSSVNNLPKDSDLYLAKRNEAYRKFEILVELEKLLSPVFSKRPKITNETVLQQ